MSSAVCQAPTALRSLSGWLSHRQMYLPAFGGWNIQVRALENSNFIKQIREKKKKKYIYIYI